MTRRYSVDWRIGHDGPKKENLVGTVLSTFPRHVAEIVLPVN